MVCDRLGRPLVMLLTEGQTSDFNGAAVMFPLLPPDAHTLIGDKGYDADWLREALENRRMTACIPSRACRASAIPHDEDLYKSRNRIERLFGRLKDWRRIAMRYDRCAHTFMSAIAIAATVIFWL